MARPPITKKRPWTPSGGRFAGRTFHTEREYRDMLAQEKGFANWYAQQRASAGSVGPKSVGRLRPEARKARKRALDAVRRMRKEDLSLSAATRKAETTPNTVLRWMGSELDRSPQGRWVPKPSDRLFALMETLTTEGVRDVEVRSSRQRSLIGGHWSALGHYRDTGDASRLAPFAGVRIGGCLLETDLDAIDEWARRGELEIEDVYSLAG